MPPRRRSLLNATSVNKFINRFPTLEYTGTIIKCVVCNISILPYDVYVCKKHVISKRHLLNEKRETPHWKFVYDLIVMLSVCNIPLHVVGNEEFRKFWSKYTPQWKLPTKRQLRYNLPRVKNTITDLIKTELKGKKIWMTVEETTNARKNCVLNVLVRALKSDEASSPLLLCSTILQKTNAESIVKTIKKTVGKFNILANQFVMLVTDGGSNMVKAGKLLKQSYPQLLHVTCVLHAFHLVAEYVRDKYPKVDQLIATTAKVLMKSQERICEFKDSCPGIPQPPQAEVTRWGTWLQGVMYYEKYFHIVKAFILKLNSQEAEAISLSQQLFSDTEIHTQIEQISANYSILLEAISKLENSNLSLSEALDIVHSLKAQLGNLTDNVGTLTMEKLCTVINKNPDFEAIVRLDKCLSDNKRCESDGKDFFKFAKITSLDVERSFSKYTNIFSPRRTCLTESTVEGLLMMQYYNTFSCQSTSTTYSD